MVKCKDKMEVTWKQDIRKTQITLEITNRHQNVHERNCTCMWKPLLDSGVLLVFVCMHAHSKERVCECTLCHGSGSLNNRIRRMYVSQTAHFMKIVARKGIAEFNLPLNFSALHCSCATAIYFLRPTSVLLTSGCPSNFDLTNTEWQQCDSISCTLLWAEHSSFCVSNNTERHSCSFQPQ